MNNRKSRFSKWELLFISATSITFLYLASYSFSHRQVMELWFIHGSYYAMLAVFAFWAIQLWRYCTAVSFSFKTFLKRYWPGLIVALALTCFMFLSLSPDYRVLSDETNLLAVSKS